MVCSEQAENVGASYRWAMANIYVYLKKQFITDVIMEYETKIK